MRVAVVPDDKFNIKKEINGTLVFIGYQVDYLHLLADLLNFTFVMIEPSDGLFGSDYDGDGTWNGILVMVQTRQADIGMAPFSQTVSRRKVVDFLEYLEHCEATMLMRKPTNSLTYGFFAILKPFHPNLRIAFVVTILLSSIVLWSFKIIDESIRYGYGFWNVKAFVNCLAYVASAAFGKGSDISWNSSILVRMFISLIWITFIILQTTYVANLISYITITKTTLPANSLKELAEQNSHQVGLMKSSSR